jgi:hypothetical protein
MSQAGTIEVTIIRGIAPQVSRDQVLSDDAAADAEIVYVPSLKKSPSLD